MERPGSVTVIGGLFFVVAAYLIASGIISLVAPDVLSPLMEAPVFYGRELDSPQTAISVGLGWALVAWGLLQLRSWARWCAVVIMALGIVGSVPSVSAAARTIGWRFAWTGSLLMLRVVVIWYLVQSPEIGEAFRGRKSSDS